MTNLLYFYSKDCLVCATAEPIIKEIDKRCDVEHIDVATREGLMRAYDLGVIEVPTLIRVELDPCKLSERLNYSGIKSLNECLKEEKKGVK